MLRAADAIVLDENFGPQAQEKKENMPALQKTNMWVRTRIRSLSKFIIQSIYRRVISSQKIMAAIVHLIEEEKLIILCLSSLSSILSSSYDEIWKFL